MTATRLALLLPLLAPGCNGTQASPQPAATAFDEARAWQDLLHLCNEIGPRRIATPGAEATREYLAAELKKLKGWTVENDPFVAVPPEGARRSGELEGVNVLARRAGTVEGELWFASHYDTFDLPGFVGANDGASSTAVLLELARCLAGEGPREGMSIVLVWFDGEERFPPEPWDDFTNSTFGSQHLVARLQQEKTLAAVRALVLLDMVGDADLGLMIESGHADPTIKKVLERAARTLGDEKLFAYPQSVKDDHIHFHRARVPVVDLIDFRFGPSNRWWHTLEDKPENCSAASLGRVGRLLLTALPELEQAFGGPKD